MKKLNKNKNKGKRLQNKKSNLNSKQIQNKKKNNHIDTRQL
jgi:hypothetical protein